MSAKRGGSSPADSPWELMRLAVQSGSPGALLEQAMTPFFIGHDFPRHLRVRCSSLDFDVRYWYFWLTDVPLEEIPRSAVLQRILDNGTDVHTRTQKVLYALQQAQSDGDMVQVDAVEGYADTLATKEIYPGVALSGHADALVTVNGTPYVLEIKSINGGDWRQLKDQPTLKHQWQARGYTLLFDRPTLFLYESKDTQRYKWIAYDPSPIDMMALQTKLHALSEVLQSQTPPPFCDQVSDSVFPKYTIGSCAYCPFQRHCHEVGQTGHEEEFAFLTNRGEQHARPH